MKLATKFKTIIAGLSIAAMLGSCDNFEDLNTNPTASTDIDPNVMLPTIQMNLTGERFEIWRNSFIYASDWMQTWTGEYATVEYGGKGKKNDAYMSATWDVQYPRDVRNVVDMVNRTAEDPEMVNINAVSRIMKAYIFSRLTDLYGDIPYFEAAEGYFTGVLKPKYDKQEDIYNDLFQELDEATTALDPAKDKVTEDVYFNGDIEKWRRFGNSLRLRLAMRLTKVNPTKAKDQAEAAIAKGVMQSNADMAVMQHINVPFGGGGKGGNGYSYTFMQGSTTESVFRICSTLGQYLVDTSDPRLRILAACYFPAGERVDITDQVFAELGSYTPMFNKPSMLVGESSPSSAITVTVNGNEESIAGKYQLLQPSRLITAIDAPAVVMSYAEVELWQAEAAFRGWSANGTASEHFSKALAAGVNQYSVYGASIDEGAVADFVSANPLDEQRALEMINNQLWINFALNGQEAFANWRRSGYPDITYPNIAPTQNQSGGEIPRRMQYSLTEYVYNAENVEAAVARMDAGDSWTGRVWWDVKN